MNDLPIVLWIDSICSAQINHTLTDLNVGGNNVDADGARHLADVIKVRVSPTHSLEST
jgi:hypothetical protein